MTTLVTLAGNTVEDKQAAAIALGYSFQTVDNGVIITFTSKKPRYTTGDLIAARNEMEQISKILYPNKVTHFYVKPAVKHLDFVMGVAETISDALKIAM